MSTRTDIVAEARAWLGTPWQHQGRVKGAGVDCAGLVIEVARACGLAAVCISGYSRFPSGAQIEQLCEQHMRRLPSLDVAQAGDVVLMHVNQESRHMGFLTDHPDGGLALLHAYAGHRKVVEHRLDGWWSSRIVAAYVLPGVQP